MEWNCTVSFWSVAHDAKGVLEGVWKCLISMGYMSGTLKSGFEYDLDCFF